MNAITRDDFTEKLIATSYCRRYTKLSAADGHMRSCAAEFCYQADDAVREKPVITRVCCLNRYDTPTKLHLFTWHRTIEANDMSVNLKRGDEIWARV